MFYKTFVIFLNAAYSFHQAVDVARITKKLEEVMYLNIHVLVPPIAVLLALVVLKLMSI